MPTRAEAPPSARKLLFPGYRLSDGSDDREPSGRKEYSPDSGKARAETIQVYGGPGTLDGKFQDASGTVPDAQGWTGVDRTVQLESSWHVDTYNCADLDPDTSPNHAWWCGETFPSCGPGDPEGGYGNNWEQHLDWYGTVAEPTSPVSVRVTAHLNHDIENAYDFLYLEHESAAGMQAVATFTGQATDLAFDQQFTVEPDDYAGVAHDQVHLRWRFWSDYGVSDEDCLLPGAGAAQVDLITVTFDQGQGETQIGSTETCEPGDTVQWTATLAVSVGDFSKVWPLLGDADPAGDNSTPQFAFIDDGEVVPGTGGYSCTTWCYGPSGYIVNPEGGLAGPQRFIRNEIWSPVLAIPSDQVNGAILAFDVYRHIGVDPQWPGIFYVWHLRSTDDPAAQTGWTEWRDNGYLYYHTSPEYYRHELYVGDLLVPHPAHVQIALGIWEIGYGIGLEGTDGSPSPYFDNVSFKAYTDTLDLADFHAEPTELHVDSPVQFFDDSHGSVTSWQWDFDHDGTIDSQTQNPIHTYAQAGNYTVSLTVTAGDSMDTLVRPGYISVWDNGNPLPDFSSTDYPHEASSTFDWVPYDPSWVSDDKLGLAHSWHSKDWRAGYDFPHWVQIDFGDTPFIITNLSLKAYQDATGARLREFYLEGSQDGSAFVPLTATPLEYGEDAGWQFFDIPSDVPYRFYRLYGLNNWCNDPDTATQMIIEEWELCAAYVAAQFEAAPLVGLAPLEVQFTDTSVGQPLTWSWDFENDGVFDANTRNPVHLYTNPGVYSVTLAVTHGTLADTLTRQAYITASSSPPVVADFVAEPLLGGAPLTVQFTDLSLNDPTEWAWDFDNDGMTDATDRNPTFVFDDVGLYTVSLRVSNGETSDTMTKTDYIEVRPPLSVNAQGTGDYPTIQAAVNAATDGDVIALADGIYQGPGNRDVNVAGKTVTIRSQSGDPQACVIDCQGSNAEPHLGFFFQSTVGSGCTLQGVTITHGYWSPWGGAVRMLDTSPAFRDCVFLTNDSNAWGSCLYIEGESQPLVEDCTFADNAADQSGGAIYVRNSGSAVLTSVTVKRCTFTGNNCSAGGAIYGENATVNVADCLFAENLSGGGGALRIGNNCDAQVTGTVFAENSASVAGGAIYCQSGSQLEMQNCTCFMNQSPAASCLYFRVNASVQLQGVIIANGLDGAAIDQYNGTSISLSCCDIYGNAGGDWTGIIASQLGTNGNISADPLLCDPQNSIFTLDETSPCAPESNPACGLIGAFPAGCVAADFSADVVLGLPPLTVQFQDLSPGEPDSWQWDFENDSQIDDTAQNPVHEYPTAGTYTVKLRTFAAGELLSVGTKQDYIRVLDGNGMIILPTEIVSGDPTPVPFRFMGSDSLGALSIYVDYDDTKLAYAGIESHVPGESFSAGLIGGRISVQWFDETGGLDPIVPGVDPDTLFALLFTNVVSADSTQLQFAETLCVLGDRVGNPLTHVSWIDDPPYGVVKINIGAVVSGRVGYYWQDKPVPAALLSMGPPNPDVVSDDAGLYAFERYPYGSYQLDIGKTGDLSGINSLDAIKVIRHSSGAEPLDDPYKEFAADVNGIPGINALDALKIVRSAIGLEPLPSGDWKFDPASVTFAPLNQDQQQDFVAIRMGDVNGDWLPDAGLPLAGARDGRPAVELAFPDTTVGSDAFPVQIPLLVAGFNDIGAISLRVTFSDTVLQYVSVISRVSNVSFFTNLVGNEIRIEWYDGTGGANPITIGADTLLAVAFDLAGAQGDSSPLHFQSSCSLGDATGDPIPDVTYLDGSCTLAGGLSSAGEPEDLPGILTFYAGFPNPFNPRTTLQYSTPQPGPVRLAVYDLRGRLIATLVNEEQEAGRHAVPWLGNDDGGQPVASGVYVAQLIAGHRTRTIKLLLAR